MSSRDEQRNIAKEKRLDIKKELYQAYSDTICLKLMNLDIYEKASLIMAYCPINNEVDTSLLLDECLEAKKLALPRTDINKKTITPCEVHSLADLKMGAYNIFEPGENCSKAAIDKIDIIVVPLVAFDKKGTRLGYGGGYYDKLLAKMPDCKKIGIAFSFQEMDSIQRENHDIELDMVITEKKIFSF